VVLSEVEFLTPRYGKLRSIYGTKAVGGPIVARLGVGNEYFKGSRITKLCAFLGWVL
jgi:hypothetical protein